MLTHKRKECLSYGRGARSQHVRVLLCLCILRGKPDLFNPNKNTQGEIRCFRNSEMLRKPDGSKFRHVSAGRLRRETCKMKIEALFRVSAALPLT